MAEELGNLGKLGTEDAERFVHGVLSELCGKQGVQYEDFAKLLTLGEYSSLRRHLSSTARILAREGLKKQEISEKLLGLGVSPELSQLVAECLSVRREEVRAQLVRDSCNISHCHLTDYDWKLKVRLASLHFLNSTASLPGSALKLGKPIVSFMLGEPGKLIMSSDKLGSIQRPVLSLDLDLSEDGQRREEGVELSKNELEKLISSLEAANKVVTQLRT